jgi:hypothetical protein
MGGKGRMEGRRCRRGKVEDQGHSLGGLLHELEVGQSIHCQLAKNITSHNVRADFKMFRPKHHNIFLVFNF